MYYFSGRMWAGLLVVTSICLAFSAAFLQCPPVVWLFGAMLFLSVLTALGISGMAAAGSADTKWILACAITAAGMAIAMLLAGFKFGDDYILPAVMYGIAGVLTGGIFFMAKARLRLSGLRMIFLYTTATVDILITAEKIIGRIF